MKTLIPGIALVMALTTGRTVSAEESSTEAPNPGLIPRQEILELSFRDHTPHENKFLDVSLEGVFTSPSGVQRRINGFYSGGDLWKIRFRPDEIGEWHYTYVLAHKGGAARKGEGSFKCTPSHEEGPVRRNEKNPFRWVYSSGKPYFPIGLQDCIRSDGARLHQIHIDGEGRGEGGKSISLKEYFAIYGQSGFNLFRFSQKNCSYSLYDDLDHYREEEGKATDELLLLARQNGFRVMYGIFGGHDNPTVDSGPVRFLKRIANKIRGEREAPVISAEDQEIVRKEKKFIEYTVARWGAYVDFWQLLNERKASDEWVSLAADSLRSVDPDRKPISTSWEKPHLSSIDMNTPHWYESESEFLSDLRVQEQAGKWKKPGKPVIVGEQGNTGMNWDPLSALRMRIRAWTALFQEISLIFWNTSWSKSGMHLGRYTPGAVANIYLGPEERRYIRVLRDFSSRLDRDVQMVPVTVFPPGRARGYGLLSGRVAAVYLHHMNNHTTLLQKAKIAIDLPSDALAAKKGLGEWIEPSSGDVLAKVEVLPGQRTLNVPPFAVDLALLITFLS